MDVNIEGIIFIIIFIAWFYKLLFDLDSLL